MSLIMFNFCFNLLWMMIKFRVDVLCCLSICFYRWDINFLEIFISVGDWIRVYFGFCEIKYCWFFIVVFLKGGCCKVLMRFFSMKWFVECRFLYFGSGLLMLMIRNFGFYFMLCVCLCYCVKVFVLWNV